MIKMMILSTHLLKLLLIHKIIMDILKSFKEVEDMLGNIFLNIPSLKSDCFLSKVMKEYSSGNMDCISLNIPWKLKLLFNQGNTTY